MHESHLCTPNGITYIMHQKNLISCTLPKVFYENYNIICPNICQMWDNSILASYGQNILLIYILTIALFDFKYKFELQQFKLLHIMGMNLCLASSTQTVCNVQNNE
jgi:hypothetical protein